MENDKMRQLDAYLLMLSKLPDFYGVQMRPDVKSPLGSTPMHIAAIRGDIDAIRLLIEAGANINEKGEGQYTPLHEAVEQGQHEAARVLINYGCNVAAENENGLTALELAKLLQDSVMVKILISAGRDKACEKS